MLIQVDYSQLAADAAALHGQGYDYEDIVARIHSRVQEITSIWQGADCEAFLSQAEALQPRLLEIGEIIHSYAALMETSARSYESVLESRMAGARSLPV